MRELRVVYRRLTSTNDIPARAIGGPSDAASALAAVLAAEATEVFGILCLDTKKRVLWWHEVARGSLDHVEVCPHEIFKAALLVNAACLVLAHNHPSGDPEPSPEDMVLTERIRRAGELLGVEVVDHVVLGDDRYCSFRETGRL